MNLHVHDDVLDDRDRLLGTLVDGDLTEQDAAKARDLLAGDAAFREAYLERVELHALLAWKFHWASTADERLALDSVKRDAFSRPRAWWRGALVKVAAAACVLLAVLGTLYVVGEHSPAAACAYLIDSYDKLGDRLYRISAQYDPSARVPDPKEFVPHRAPLPSIDGAQLYVGNDGKFVLFRRYADGEELINGGNGRESWSVRGDSNVKVSAKPDRFGGDIPGGRLGLPFLDMRAALEQLRREFRLQILPAQRLSEKSGVVCNGLRGARRGPGPRGEQTVEVWYDPSNGLIQRMTITGGTQRPGDPVSATLNLLEVTPRPANWYDHDAHHEPGRPVMRIEN